MKASKRIEGLVKEAMECRQTAKELFSEADKIDAKLMKLMDVGTEVVLSTGETVVLQDNFDGKNLAWKASPFRRFEFVVKKPKEKRE